MNLTDLFVKIVGYDAAARGIGMKIKAIAIGLALVALTGVILFKMHGPVEETTVVDTGGSPQFQ